jgi:ribosomal protein L4
MKKKALRSILSQKVIDNTFIIVDDLEKIEKPSTKKITEFLKKLKLESKKVLFLSDAGLEKTILSLRNIQKTKSIRVENINILDLMSYGRVMVNKDSIEKLTKQLKS